MLQYLTMVCDIKNSRKLKDRESVQYKLIDVLKEANIKFAEQIVSPFIITIGDEWQGLLVYPCDYKCIMDFFYEKMGDVDFYCGIGIGEISIHNFDLTVNQLDGPAFYSAREAISIAKESKHSLVLIQ
jgi:SatD family protein